MEFHKAQLEAIRHFNGPCITLAGPGSGKTTVLTYRILNLIEKCGVAAGAYFSDYFYEGGGNRDEGTIFEIVG